jgi:phenylacetyl-CoA:acceptor oxidoreductase subunit 2
MTTKRSTAVSGFDPAAPTLQTVWDWRAAGNFIGGGTGTGLLLVTTVAALTGTAILVPSLVGLAFVALGLSLVWLEIGRPLRALHVFFHPQTSWMTREASVAGPLMLIGVLTLWFQALGLMLALGLLAAIFLYCQARILHASRGIPVWRTPRIVPLILITGVAEGAGVFLVILPLLPIETLAGAERAAQVLLLAFAVLRFGAWRSYRAGLEGDAPLAALEVLKSSEAVVSMIGSLAPAALVIAALMVPGYATELGVVAGVLAVIGGWFLKYIIITRASYNQGYALVHTPARGGGKPGPGTKPGW